MSCHTGTKPHLTSRHLTTPRSLVSAKVSSQKISCPRCRHVQASTLPVVDRLPL